MTHPSWQLLQEDVHVALRAMPDCWVDGCVTDPPYGFGTREPTREELVAYLTEDAELNTGGDFLGHDWHVPSVSVWKELLRVLRPGAPILCFAGPRTCDLLVLGLRAAGFEIRDEISEFFAAEDARLDFLRSLTREQRKLFARAFEGSPLLAWIKAQGFAKSADNERAVSMRLCTLPGRHYSSVLPRGEKRQDGDHLCPRATAAERFDGHGTALRPNHEPIIVARKPLDGTLGENLLRWGVGGLAIDACRIEAGPKQTSNGGLGGYNGHEDAAYESGRGREYTDEGRWPSNIAMVHARGCRPIGPRRVRGTAPTGPNPGNHRGPEFGHAGEPSAVARQHVDAEGYEVVDAWECVPGCPARKLDEQSGNRPGMSGGGKHKASYVGGMFGAVDSSTARGDQGGASRFFWQAKVDRTERDLGCDQIPVGELVDEEDEGPKEARNNHPTVKPIDLIRKLARLVLPPSRASGEARRLLVPYSGSGSEVIGALRAGWDEVVGIERDERYVQIAKARIERWAQVPLEMSIEDVRAKVERRKATHQASLFEKDTKRGS